MASLRGVFGCKDHNHVSRSISRPNACVKWIFAFSQTLNAGQGNMMVHRFGIPSIDNAINGWVHVNPPVAMQADQSKWNSGGWLSKCQQTVVCRKIRLLLTSVIGLLRHWGIMVAFM